MWALDVASIVVGIAASITCTNASIVVGITTRTATSIAAYNIVQMSTHATYRAEVSITPKTEFVPTDPTSCADSRKT